MCLREADIGICAGICKIKVAFAGPAMIDRRPSRCKRIRNRIETGFGEGVRTSCHGIIKAAEITAAALGDKVAAAVAAHGDKAAVAVASHRKILMR